MRFNLLTFIKRKYISLSCILAYFAGWTFVFSWFHETHTAGQSCGAANAGALLLIPLICIPTYIGFGINLYINRKEKDSFIILKLLVLPWIIAFIDIAIPTP